MRITIIGAKGFVASAFVRLLNSRQDIELAQVTRQTYTQYRGRESDVVIDAAGNSKKFLADQTPVEELDSSVVHRLRTLLDFPAKLHLHVSSVDVYNDLASPESTRENAPVDIAKSSRYGAHKFLAEQLVRQYASRWLIVRLGGMVGPGLRKNPVFDVLRSEPLWVHPDSQYQFLHTDDAARIAWELARSGATGEAFNVCGDGLISPRDISLLAERPLNLTLLPKAVHPRVVNANVTKIKGFIHLPATRQTVETFVSQWKQCADRPWPEKSKVCG
jgi:nucleoside-diphosphate-sugar epimerase